MQWFRRKTKSRSPWNISEPAPAVPTRCTWRNASHFSPSKPIIIRIKSTLCSTCWDLQQQPATDCRTQRGTLRNIQTFCAKTKQRHPAPPESAFCAAEEADLHIANGKNKRFLDRNRAKTRHFSGATPSCTLQRLEQQKFPVRFGHELQTRPESVRAGPD